MRAKGAKSLSCGTVTLSPRPSHVLTLSRRYNTYLPQILYSLSLKGPRKPLVSCGSVPMHTNNWFDELMFFHGGIRTRCPGNSETQRPQWYLLITPLVPPFRFTTSWHQSVENGTRMKSCSDFRNTLLRRDRLPSRVHARFERIETLFKVWCRK